MTGAHILMAGKAVCGAITGITLTSELVKHHLQTKTEGKVAPAICKACLLQLHVYKLQDQLRQHGVRPVDLTPEDI